MKTIVILFAIISSCPINLLAQRAWKRFGDLQQRRSNFGALAISPSKVLVMGGYINTSQITASCEIIDAIQRTVSPAATMNVARSQTVFLLTRDSNVVAISGMSNGNVTPLCELYDRLTNKWSIIGSLNIARRLFFERG
jgi:hypothetical protein